MHTPPYLVDVQSLRLKVLYNSLPSMETVELVKLLVNVTTHFPIFVDDFLLGKIMSLAALKVFGVVSWCNFDNTCNTACCK